MLPCNAFPTMHLLQSLNPKMAPALSPFSFSLLPAPKTKPIPITTLQLISIPSLPLSLSEPAAREAQEDVMPDWVVKLLRVKGAAFAWKVMEKEIYASDISNQQNRLMIRNQVVAERIVPEMSEEERAAANLTAGNFPAKRRRLCGGEGDAVERIRGREHGGLEVMVYDRKGWGCPLYLTRWDASKSSVLKGGNYKEFNRRSHFSAGDMVEMWGFRGDDGRLSFAIGNKVDVELSL